MNSPSDKFQRRLDRLRRLHQIGVDLLAQIRGKRILDARRRRTSQLVGLGIVLTLIVLALDLLGVLQGMENFFYDQRCYYFQFFRPLPSSQIVHLDIDDNALQSTQQKWPWERTDQARVIREIAQARPKVVFLDILYTEPDQVPEQDEALKAAIEEAGNVLVPITCNLKIANRTSEVERQLVTELMKPGQLSETPDRLLTRLGGKDFLNRTAQSESLFNSRYLIARQQAARSVVLSILQKNPASTLEDVARELGLNVRFQTATLAVVREVYAKLQRDLAVDRFCRTIPGNFLNDVVLPNNFDPPLASLSGVAASSGFVDFIPAAAGDARVRFVPLWINVNGRALPHVSLAMACKFLGVDIKSLEMRADRLVIPDRVNNREVVIPTRLLRRKENQNAAFVADIPWFGGREWETMYDVPLHKAIRQHYSLTLVTSIFTSERNIDTNVRDLIGLLKTYMGEIDSTLKETFDTYAPGIDDVPTLLDELIGKAVIPAINDREQALTAQLIRSPLEEQTLKVTIPRLRDMVSKYGTLLPPLLDERARLKSELKAKLEGKIVLIGFAATGTIDQYPTPLHNLAPGVVAHGALVNGILTNFFWGRAPDYYTYALIILLGVITTFVVAAADPWRSTLFAVVTLLLYVVINGYYLFDYRRIVVGVAGPLTVIVVTWAVVTLARFISEIVERNRITTRFSHYVDPELVNYVVENPEEADFKGREKEMTVVFTDLQGFTTIAETLGAGAVSVLNDYVARMTPIFRNQNGFLDKFLGDGIMILFNAVRPNPGHALDAVTSVLRMQAAMDPINDDLRARNLPELRMRVGINSGTMIVGDAGGPGAANFTVLGDNVNLAARLESANKPFGSLVLLTQSTLDLVGRDLLAVRPIARVRVKGKSQAVMVFEPLCFKKDLTPPQARLIELTENVFNAFVAADFARCISACDAMTAELGETKFASLYRQESQVLVETPPAQPFDGVVELHEK